MVTFLSMFAWVAALMLGLALGLVIRHLRRRPRDGSFNDACCRAVVAHAGEGILVVEAASGRVLEANPALLRKLGYCRAELPNLCLQDILVETAAAARGAGANRPTTLARSTREVMQRGRDGSLVPVDVSASAFRIHGRPALCYVIRDATPRKTREDALLERHSEAEQRADYLTHRDALTGLANRRSLGLELRNAIEDTERAGTVALLLLDISDFSSINDTLGPDVGDTVLVEVAARLRHIIRDGGCVARVGNDEFALMLHSTTDPETAGRVAIEVQDALSTPMPCLGHPLEIRVNVGISLCPPDEANVDILLSHADLALSQAKAERGGGVQFFDPRMNAEVRRRLQLQQALKDALDSDQLTIHYQPVVDIVSRRMLGLEALVRWQHPGLGLISPGDFIPIAEQTGLIVPLGERVLRLVCEQVVRWRRRGVPIVPVAVNLSPQHFHRQSVAKLVQEIVQETGMAPHDLGIEITEGSLMSNAARYAADLQALRAAGVRILVDDFGTGYSSLSYLKHLPLDTLKIDRSFISNIDANPADEAIVSAILAMARSLGLKVVAEGVETKEQLAVLERHGCQMAQGYYFSRPIPADQCVRLLLELARRPSFTDTLRLQLNKVASGKPRLSVIR